MGLVALGAAEHDGFGRRAEQRVGAIEFEARGAAAGEAEIADDLALDIVENPGDFRRVGGGQAAVIGAFEAALGGEADADEFLGRAVLAAPEAAIAGIELLEVLAGLGRPGAGAALGAAQFSPGGPSCAGSSC